MPDDRLPALEEIRERGYENGARGAHAARLSEAAGVRACQDCTATVYNSCTGCGPQVNVDLCPTRNAITRVLTGEDDGEH